MCVCVCVCVCVREGGRERESVCARVCVCVCARAGARARAISLIVFFCLLPGESSEERTRVSHEDGM